MKAKKKIHLPVQVTGLSNGLSIPCSVCHDTPKFDYIVEDGIWNKLIPKPWRTGVVCLGCLDLLGYKQGINVADHLLFVQFTGIEKTVVLRVDKIFVAGDEKHWTQF